MTSSTLHPTAQGVSMFPPSGVGGDGLLNSSAVRMRRASLRGLSNDNTIEDWLDNLWQGHPGQDPAAFPIQQQPQEHETPAKSRAPRNRSWSISELFNVIPQDHFAQGPGASVSAAAHAHHMSLPPAAPAHGSMPDPNAYARTRRTSFSNGAAMVPAQPMAGIPESYSYEQVDFDDLYPRPQSPSEIRKFLQGTGEQQEAAQQDQQQRGTLGIFSQVAETASNLFRRASIGFANFGSRRSSFDLGLGSSALLGGGVPQFNAAAPAPAPVPEQEVSEDRERAQFKQDAIEVASFLHEVRAASVNINAENAIRSCTPAPHDADMDTVSCLRRLRPGRKPEPIEQRGEQSRRTMSGTVYPMAGPFEENSNVGICMLLPKPTPQLDTSLVTLDLEQFFMRCPIDGRVTSVRWADNVRGQVRKKKNAPVKSDKVRTTANKFDHCCFVNMSLPGGFEHVSVKVFKTGRLQTAGCKNGSMSLDVCKIVASCLNIIAQDGNRELLFKTAGGNVNPMVLNRLATDAPLNVRLEKQSILGVFDLGFKDKGFSVDMEELRMLLSHPDSADRISKVIVPKSDKNMKVQRFQGLGVYVNKDCLTNADNNVFVNIFPTGKCTVTAASTLLQATEVSTVIGKLIIDLFVQCRKRDSDQPASKRQRRSRN